MASTQRLVQRPFHLEKKLSFAQYTKVDFFCVFNALKFLHTYLNNN